VGHATKVMHQHLRNLQVQGLPQRSWGTTRVWYTLLGNALSSSNLGGHQTDTGACHGLSMEHSHRQFCPGLPTGNLYMKLPRGVTLGKGISRSTHALHLIKNIYGLKQAGQVWNCHLHEGLMKLQFSQSDYDPCIYYHSNVIMGVYVDDCLVVSPTAAKTLKVYKTSKQSLK